uniref:Uncharacterized protein n=1 Tax=Arundo donax TaxID=35708 RepID=A0A0A9CHV4_ARUDO
MPLACRMKPGIQIQGCGNLHRKNGFAVSGCQNLFKNNRAKIICEIRFKQLKVDNSRASNYCSTKTCCTKSKCAARHLSISQIMPPSSLIFLFIHTSTSIPAPTPAAHTAP